MDSATTPDDLIAAYRETAIVIGEADEVGDYRTANRASDRLQGIRRTIRRSVPDYRARVLALLDDDNLFVRLQAGIDALGLDPSRGEPVLATIAKRPRGMAAIEAKMSLTQWRKGEFVVSWWDETNGDDGVGD